MAIKVCVLGLPMCGKTELIEDLESRMEGIVFVEDDSLGKAILGKHSGALEEANSHLQKHQPADAYVLLDTDPRVIAKRLRMYSDFNISGTGFMKVLHKTRHELKSIVHGSVKPTVVLRSKDQLTIDGIATLIQKSINP